MSDENKTEIECIDQRCVLCFDPLPQHSVLRLHCTHEYHMKCWIKVVDKTLCPLCRRFTEEEVRVMAQVSLPLALLQAAEVSPFSGPEIELNELGLLFPENNEVIVVEDRSPSRSAPRRRQAGRQSWRYMYDQLRRLNTRMRDLTNYAERQMRQP